MSKIDLSNYEFYLLDYSEGKLNPADLSELVVFISRNPDLGIDLSDFTELPRIHEDIIKSGIQHKLHKSEADINNQFDELCYKFYNKEITSEEKSRLDYLIKQFPNLEVDFIAFSHAFLNDTDLVRFENKDSLKKQFTSAGSFEDLAVKAIEGTINKSEKAQLDSITAENTIYQKELTAFKSAILVEEIIPFPNKEALYKKNESNNIILLWTARLAVAASVLFVFGYFLLNNSTENNSALAGVSQKHNDSVRKSIEIQSIESDIPFKDDVKSNTSEKSIQLIQQINRVINNSENTFTSLDLKSPYSIMRFELPSEYIGLKPNELLMLNQESVVTIETGKEFITPSQYIWKQVKKLMVNNKIDIDKPIEELKNDGFAEVGIRSLEKVSRGALVIERENSENGSKITGVQFKGIGFSKSTQ